VRVVLVVAERFAVLDERLVELIDLICGQRALRRIQKT
jgi:hypothetical protein